MTFSESVNQTFQLNNEIIRISNFPTIKILFFELHIMSSIHHYINDSLSSRIQEIVQARNREMIKREDNNNIRGVRKLIKLPL